MRKSVVLLVVASLAFSTIGFQCEKEYPKPEPVYSFTEKLTLTPYKKVYAVNDTIWIQFQTTDRKLFDRLSGTHVATDTTTLAPTFYYRQRHPVETARRTLVEVKASGVAGLALDYFRPYILETKFRIECGVGTYFFKVGFVPKTIGIYSIEPHGYVGLCPNKRKQLPTTFNWTFELADCNKDIFQSIPAASILGREDGYTDAHVDRKEIFVFKVE
ncbi:hypothetical protein BEN47_19195 [Hymenobacter lapidarius]|uniref:Lipoprotein n=1 Tax=Hymenobacter lapidarius TaxID=1908237 RepID=A0A1G1SSG8_9BACT|nr:hypothetical protein [Hymenobacter lapidarius]OGX81567.1 hypothetical protein BEN47_19195 [Hymenobacter lapidarius]